MHRVSAGLLGVVTAIGVLLSLSPANAQGLRAWSPETPGCRSSSECTDPGVAPPKDVRCFDGQCVVPPGNCTYVVRNGLSLGFDTMTYQCVSVPETCDASGNKVQNVGASTFKPGAQCDPQTGRGLAPYRTLPAEFKRRHDSNGRPPTYICDLYTCLVRYCGDGIIQTQAPLSEECDGTALATGVSSDATCTQRSCKAMSLTFAPNSIRYGDPLGAGQLNAVASVQGGKISYSSPTITPWEIGTIPTRSGTHKVTATWSPTTDDAKALYDAVSKDGLLVVNRRAAKCTADSYEKMENDPTPAFTFGCDGVLAGDRVGGQVVLEPGANPNEAGSYRIVFNPEPKNPDYNISVAEGKLTVKADAVAGGCGIAAKEYESGDTVFQGELCAAGRVSPAAPAFPAAGSSTTWSCSGANGGVSATCTATRKATAVDGVCGPAARRYRSTDVAFDGALCIKGQVDPVTPEFPRVGQVASWSCLGESDGLDAVCLAWMEGQTLATEGGAGSPSGLSGSPSGGPGGSSNGASGASGSAGKLSRDEFCAAVARCPLQHTSCKDPFAPICPKCSEVEEDVQCDSQDPPAIARKTAGGPMQVKAVLDNKSTLDRSDDEWNCKCVCSYGESDHAVGCGAQPKPDPCAGFVASAGGCSIDPVPWSCLSTDSCRSEIIPWINPQPGQGGQPAGGGNGQGTNNPRVCCKQLLGS